jgi:hypothetical protein
MTYDDSHFFTQLCQSLSCDELFHKNKPFLISHINSIKGNRHIIIVASAPKTGGTFIANTLGKISGYPMSRMCFSYNQNEHDLYLPHLYFFCKSGVVSQLHMRASAANIQLMQLFQIKPIVVVRNIFDIALSLANEIDHNENKNINDITKGYSFYWGDNTIFQLNFEQRLDMIIDLTIPWFIHYYVSWFEFCTKGYIKAKWVKYEWMMENKKQTILELVDFLGIQSVMDIEKIEKIIDIKYATFYKGKSGEGNRMLSSDQKNRILKLFRYYPNVDFSLFD